MPDYEVEQLGHDHQELLTGSLEASLVARCRESGGPPWPLDLSLQRLPRAGTGVIRVSLRWGTELDDAARKAERTHPDTVITEWGAVGASAASFAALNEGEITEVTQFGTRVDYWVDDRRALLELSGIRRGEPSDLANRHRQKADQLQSSVLFKRGKPGYVFVILFSGKSALFTYWRPIR